MPDLSKQALNTDGILTKIIVRQPSTHQLWVQIENQLLGSA